MHKLRKPQTKLLPMLLILVALLSTNASGVNKCTASNGKVTYSDASCPTNSVQKPLNLGGTGAPAFSTELEMLRNEEARLKWVVKGAEADVRRAQRAYRGAGAGSNEIYKFEIAQAALTRVQERMLEITDPVGYKNYLHAKIQFQQEQRIQAIQSAAQDASVRATAAQHQAQQADARASAAEIKAEKAQKEADAANSQAISASISARSAGGF